MAAAWGDQAKMPVGYVALGRVSLEPGQAVFFTVYAPKNFVDRAEAVQVMEVFIETVRRELWDLMKSAKFLAPRSGREEHRIGAKE